MCLFKEQIYAKKILLLHYFETKGLFQICFMLI